MNNKKQGLILLVVSILVVTIGLTYAYYSASVQGTGNTNAEASATTATLGEVEFNGENTFDTTNIGRDIYPGFIGVQTFTIAPYANGHGIYEIDLEANVPAAFGSDIKITLYKTSDATNNSIDSEEGSLTITNNQYVKQDTLTITGTLTKVYEGVLTDTDEEVLEQVEFLIENNEFNEPDTTPDNYYTYCDEPFAGGAPMNVVPFYNYICNSVRLRKNKIIFGKTIISNIGQNQFVFFSYFGNKRTLLCFFNLKRQKLIIVF